MKSRRSVAVFVLGLLPIALLFQNCGEGFQSNFNQSDVLSTGPLSISVTDTNTIEGRPLAFAVTLSKPDTEDIVVEWQTVDGTATAGTHYVPATGSITIPAGETLGIIEIPSVRTDSTVERTFGIQILSVSKGIIANNEAVGTVEAGIVSVNNIVQIDGGRERTWALDNMGRRSHRFDRCYTSFCRS